MKCAYCEYSVPVKIVRASIVHTVGMIPNEQTSVMKAFREDSEI